MVLDREGLQLQLVPTVDERHIREAERGFDDTYAS